MRSQAPTISAWPSSCSRPSSAGSRSSDRRHFVRRQPPYSADVAGAVQSGRIRRDQVGALVFAKPVRVPVPDCDLHQPVHARAVAAQMQPEPAIVADLHIYETVWARGIAIDLVREEALRPT